MDQGPGDGIDEADRFVRDGLEFVPAWDRPSQPGSLTLLKNISLVEAYEQLLAPYPKPRMVELGISQGGSVALLALIARPERFVAVELAAEPVQPLLDALAERGLDQTVTPYFGVDQADRVRLTQILRDDFGDEPLDVVIDDASHLYDPTLASFEVLFPRLRPGGVYVIEDWNCHDLNAKDLAGALDDPASPRGERFQDNLAERMEAVFADPTSPEAVRLKAQLEAHLAKEADGADRAPTPPPPPPTATYAPLSRLALQLTLARAHAGGAVADVRVDGNWIVVHRGLADLDPGSFRLDDLVPDPYHQLTPRSAP